MNIIDTLVLNGIFISCSIIINEERYSYKNGFIIGVQLKNISSNIIKIKSKIVHSGDTCDISIMDFIDYLYSDNCNIKSSKIYKEQIYFVEKSKNGNLMFTKDANKALKNDNGELYKFMRSDDFIYVKAYKIDDMDLKLLSNRLEIPLEYLNKLKRKERKLFGFLRR